MQIPSTETERGEREKGGGEGGGQTDKQTDRQTYRHIETWTQTERQID